MWLFGNDGDGSVDLWQCSGECGRYYATEEEADECEENGCEDFYDPDDESADYDDDYYDYADENADANYA